MTNLSTEARGADSKTFFGFWIYLMTDFVLFAGLFAVFVVLRGNIFGGPGGAAIFTMPLVLTETLLLLTSSLTCGLSLLGAARMRKGETLFFLTITILLGLAFVILEATEFFHLLAMGDEPSRSGFLSAYFTLVGTHGLHVSIGLLWLCILGILIFKQGLSRSHIRKLLLGTIFWHFLDIIWIFIFTIVYLTGVI